MEVYAKLRFIRTNPFRARRVAKLVYRKDAETASAILLNIPQRAGKIIYKVLQSAIANAVHNYELNKDKLVVSKVIVNEATPYKRMSPRAMGRADVIKRKTSHITVYLKEVED
jgi:large subunit ribosomal protein L22